MRTGTWLRRRYRCGHLRRRRPCLRLLCRPALLALRRTIGPLIGLARHWLARAVVEVLSADRLLPSRLLRVAALRISALVSGQRRRRWRSVSVPVVPAGPALLPLTTPVLVPAGRCVGTPVTEVRRWLAVVVHRHAQHVRRHIQGHHALPGSVVPTAGVPVLTLQHPVEAVVIEVVARSIRRVVHGVAWHALQVGKGWQVDADADAGHFDADAHRDLGLRSGNLTQQEGQHKHQAAHCSLESRPVAAHAAGNEPFSFAHVRTFPSTPGLHRPCKHNA